MDYVNTCLGKKLLYHIYVYFLIEELALLPKHFTSVLHRFSVCPYVSFTSVLMSVLSSFYINFTSISCFSLPPCFGALSSNQSIIFTVTLSPLSPTLHHCAARPVYPAAHRPHSIASLNRRWPSFAFALKFYTISYDVCRVPVSSLIVPICLSFSLRINSPPPSPARQWIT